MRAISIFCSIKILCYTLNKSATALTVNEIFKHCQQVQHILRKISNFKRLHYQKVVGHRCKVSSIEFEMSVACWVHMSTCLLTLSIPEYTWISLNEPHFNINWAIYSHILHGKHVSSCNFKIASILEPRFSEIAVLLSGKRWCIKNEAFNVEIKRNNFIKDPQNDLGSTIFIHDPSDTILIVQFCFHDLETLGF